MWNTTAYKLGRGTVINRATRKEPSDKEEERDMDIPIGRNYRIFFMPNSTKSFCMSGASAKVLLKPLREDEVQLRRSKHRQWILLCGDHNDDQIEDCEQMMPKNVLTEARLRSFRKTVSHSYRSVA